MNENITVGLFDFWKGLLEDFLNPDPPGKSEIPDKSGTTDNPLLEDVSLQPPQQGVIPSQYKGALQDFMLSIR